ncbi:hypothetical protein LQL77_07135 [Rhodococcus cerastii]|nr:hypothetical protein [Rhodococcus cerastii]
MSKVISAFPQIRLAIYGIASVTLAGLVIAGVVTEGQSSNILNYVGLGLGALATLLAAQNVTKPVADQQLSADAIGDLIAMVPGVKPAAGQATPGVNDVISQSIQQVQTALAPSVDEIRAQLERQLGHRPGG